MLLRAGVLMFMACGLALGQSAPPATPQTAQGPLLIRPQLAPLVTASDAAAVSTASQVLNAAGGLRVLGAIQDFTATGQITYYWAGKQDQGSVTLRGRGLNEFRMDAMLLEGTRSWAVNGGLGKLRKADGGESSIPGHNAAGMGDLTFPALYLALASAAPTTTVSTIGTAEVNGVNALQVRVQRHYAASYDPTGIISRLTTRDFFVDPATSLIVKTEVMTHPLKTFSVSLPEDFYFSDYQRVNGAAVPFTITETINGQKIWTIQLSSIQFNSGLSDANFSL